MNAPPQKTLYIQGREEECFERLARLIARLGILAPTIIDVGGHIGQSIERFRKVWPESRIHSFEPTPSAFAELSSKWGKASGITLRQTALTDTTGSVPFHVTRIAEVASLLRPTERMRKISTEHKYDYQLLEVRADTLDNYCNGFGLSKIDILKIDVQGAELSVLKGSRSLIERHGISLIYLETTFADCYDGQATYADTLVFLSEFGYQLWDMSPFLYTGHDRLWAANSIFLSKACTAKLEE